MFNGEENNKWVSTKFLFGEDIVRPYAECPVCSENMTFMTSPWDMEKAGTADRISGNKNCFMMRCKACKKKKSVFHGTLFFNTHLKIHTFVDYYRMLLCKTDRMATAGMTGWHKKTVMKYDRILREAVSTHIYLDIKAGLDGDHPQELCMIGGPGVEVQIDESAFGKRKYNRGHPVSTKWVVGGVGIVPDSKGRKRGGDVFFVVVPNRNMQTLNEVIAHHVRPGTHVVTDCWTTRTCRLCIAGLMMTRLYVFFR